MPYYTRNMVRFMRRNEHGRVFDPELSTDDDESLKKSKNKRKTSKTVVDVRKSKQNVTGNDRRRVSKVDIRSCKSSQNVSGNGKKSLKSSKEKKEKQKDKSKEKKSNDKNSKDKDSKINEPKDKDSKEKDSKNKNSKDKDKKSDKDVLQNDRKLSKTNLNPTPDTEPGAPLQARSSHRRLQVTSLQRIGNRDRQTQRILRISPSWVDIEALDAMKRLDKEGKNAMQVDSLGDMKYDAKRLQFQQNMLRLMVDKIHRLEGPDSMERLDDKIRIDWDAKYPNIRSLQAEYYKTKHTKMGRDEIITKTVKNYRESLKNPLYVKILRHLGKKHPFIIQTWDIFDSNGMLVIIQEYAAKGDLNQYLQNCNIVNEESINTWARQLFNAMDYLGDMAVCHRNLMPKYILFSQKNNEIKLTGFYNAIVYWDPIENDIESQPCRALSTRCKDSPDFQAPEVYGNNDYEFFDPVQADMWSLGAILFYALTKTYPFDFRVNNPKIEEEIQKKVKELSGVGETGIGEECRQFFSEILTTNVPQRLNFDKLYKHDFFVKIHFRRPSMLTGLKVE